MNRKSVPICLTAFALGLSLGAGVTPHARAHTNSTDAPPILEQVAPEVDGLDVDVAFSANYQFVVTNTGAEEFVVMATSGEPFLRIGPDGVFGNFASKAWFESRAPDGLTTFPPVARAGKDVPPDWRLVRRQPNYGWFDHRLHPVERYVNPEVRRSKKPVTVGEPWVVPIRYGTTPGEIRGRFEFQPVLGSYRSLLRSPVEPAEGVSVNLSPSPTKGGVPALFVENRSAAPVTILGSAGEPFVRLATVAEVNTHSPTWHAVREAQGQTVDGGILADAAAEPVWQEVQASPKWGWPELRAAAPVGNPPDRITKAERATTVTRWEVPMVIGDEQSDITGTTEFVPISVLLDPAGAESTPTSQTTSTRSEQEGDDGEKDEKDGGIAGPLLVSTVLWSLGLGIFYTRRKKAKLAQAQARSRAAASAPPPDRPGRRTRSTPKPRR